MSIQPIIQKEKPIPLRIAIVGARSSKWTKEQEKTMKMVIEHILENLKNGQIVAFDNDGKLLTSGKNIHYTELGYTPEVIVVSGHCPVGKELKYCVTHDQYMLGNFSDEYVTILPTIYKDKHQLIKVYDQGGVDTEAEIQSAKLGIKTEIYPAVCTNSITRGFSLKECSSYARSLGKWGLSRNHMWENHFKPRNIEVAKSDIVYDLEPKGSCKYCKGTGRREYFEDPKTKSGISGIYKCDKCEGSGSYGGGTWTLNYAKKLGKEVHKVIIE